MKIKLQKSSQNILVLGSQFSVLGWFGFLGVGVIIGSQFSVGVG
jgi:hypothetical protein